MKKTFLKFCLLGVYLFLTSSITKAQLNTSYQRAILLQPTNNTDGSSIQTNTGTNGTVWYKFIAGSNHTRISAYSGLGESNNSIISSVISTAALITNTNLYTLNSSGGLVLNSSSLPKKSLENETFIESENLTIGRIYYIEVVGQSTRTGFFRMAIVNKQTAVQSVNSDCSTATKLCGMNPVSVSSLTGIGTTDDLGSSTCFAHPEQQSQWYSFRVSTSGTLTFLISPSLSTDDYDFAIYDITNGCGTKGNPLRCSYAQPSGTTGLTTTSTSTNESATGSRYCKYLDVQACRTYVILIDNFSASTRGFTLTFGGTARFQETAPVVNIVASNINCNSATFTGTVTSDCMSNTTYLWNFGSGASPSTYSSGLGPITVTYSTAGIKNVSLTATNGCGTTSKPLQIQLGLPITITPTPSSTVCQGSPVTLSVPAIYTSYSWSNGATTSSTTIANPSNSIYKVTVTDGSPCPKTGTIQITINPKPSVSLTANSICSGAISSTLVATPSGGTPPYPSYDWSDGSHTSVGNISVSPTTSTTYAVTVTDNKTCTNSASVNVDVLPICPCSNCPNILASNISTDPPSGSVYCINTDIHITGNVRFLNSEFKIADGATIYVDAGNTLTIEGSHLYTCGNFMWEGIRTANNSKINIIGSSTKSSFIEDAYIAVAIGDISGAVYQTNEITINDAVFNRNYIGVVVIGLTQPTSGSVYAVSVQNTIFTGRNIQFTPGAFNWPSASTLKQWVSYLSLESNYQVGNRSQQNLKLNKFGGVKVGVGIFVAKTGEKVGTVYQEVRIGVPTSTPIFDRFNQTFNLFDNGSIGIYVLASNVTSYNNVFQYTQLDTRGNSEFQGKESGIYADNSERASGTTGGNNTNRLQVIGLNYPNKFYYCHNAVRSVGSEVVNINNCYVASVQTTAQAASTHQGSFGFHLTSPNSIVNINNNSINNIESPITINGAGTQPKTVSVTGNTITRLPANNIVYSSYISTAIDITGASFPVTTGKVDINNNTITQAYRGINCENWNGFIVNTNNNKVSLLNDALDATAQQYGIRHANNIGKSNPHNSLVNNNITGFNFTRNNVQGVYTSQCSNQSLTCNTTKTLYSGLEFAGGQPGTVTNNNTMENNHYGFVLSESGIIGPQGGNGNPVKNIWNGNTWATTNPGVPGTSATLNYKTACFSESPATSSPFYVSGPYNSVPTTNPDRSGYSDLSLPVLNRDQGFYTTTTAASNGKKAIITTFGATQFLPCGGVGPGPVVGPTFGTLSLMEQIVLDQINFTLNPLETKFINKHIIYDMIEVDSTLSDSSAILKQFQSNTKSRCIGQLNNIQSALASKNYAQAYSLVNSLDLIHPTEANYRTYYNIYIKVLTDTTSSDTSMFKGHKYYLTADEEAELSSLANGCPFVDGRVVYEARSLYNAIYKTNKVFNNSCLESSNARIANNEPLTSKESLTFDAMIYPNPSSNGLIQIAPIGYNFTILDVSITDIMGREVFKGIVNVENGFGALNLNVKAGIYSAKISNKVSGENIVKKLMINQ